MKVRCPHCHAPIDLLSDTSLSDITCPSCGSSFGLLGEDETVSFKGTETKTLGHFELIEQIGVGSFGCVWRARDTELDRVVAVKIPRKGQLDAAETEQFLREARAAAQLRHRNIVTVHEVGRDGDTVFIVSDFIDGVTLSEWLTGKKLTAREAAELCAQIAEALHHAHEAGIVHRDLKPGNIILDADGKPHIMDFGLARREVGEVTITVEGRVLGTPAYMSPEQAKGEAHQADRRSDVYSLGVILFELLTGERPFRGSARMLLYQIIHDDPPSPRRLAGTTPRDLETICLKCLEKEPSKRYANAGAVGDELRHYLAGEPIEARPITRLARGWRWYRRNKMAASLATTTLLALLIGLAASIYSASVAKVVAEQRRRDLYVSDMNVVQQAWAENNRDRTVQLLAKYKPNNGDQKDLREFEWFYYWNLCHRVLSEQIPLANMGTSVAFSSPSGKCLAVGQAGGSELVELFQFDGKTWHRKDRFGPGGWSISSLAFTPDEKFLAYPRPDGTVVLRSLNDKTEQVLDLNTAPVRAIAISPDGQYLASGGNDDVVVVQDLLSETPHRIHVGKEGVYALAFSPDGRLLATAGGDGHLKFWDTSNFREHDCEPEGAFFRGTNGGAIAFSPDSLSIAGAGENNTFLVASAAGGKPITIDSGHDQEIRAFAFSPNGRILATGSRDSSIRLWNVDTWSLDRVLKGHGAYVQSVAFSPDGSLLASASRDFSVQVWDLKNSPTQPESIGIRELVRDVYAVDSSDQLLVLLDHDRMRRVNTRSGYVSPEIAAPCKNVLRMAVSSDGLIATVGQGGLYLWRLADSDKFVRLETNGDIPPSSAFASPLKFSFSGNYLAMGCASGIVRVWDAGRGKLLHKLPAHGAEVVSVALTTQAPARLATGDRQGRVKLWDVASGRQIKAFESHRAPVNCLAFSPDGKMLVSGSFDNTIKVWNLGDVDASPTVLRGHAGPVHNLLFCKRGRTFISCGGDMKIRLWDATSLRIKTVLACPGSVSKAALTKDESVLASVMFGRKPIRLWHAPRDGKLQ